jgi:uncharacterized membrane protein
VSNDPLPPYQAAELSVRNKAAGDPDTIRDLAGVRERFHETRWAGWNLVRVVTSTGAFACLARALVLYGRSTG